MARPHTARAINKRPASPLDSDTRTPTEGTWNYIQRQNSIGGPSSNLGARVHASHLHNAAPLCDYGIIHDGHTPWSPANSNGWAYLSPGSFGSTTSPGVYSAVTCDQYRFGSGLVSSLQDQPLFYFPVGYPHGGNVPQPQPSATGAASSDLPFTSAALSSQTRTVPAATHGHTASYSPYLPLTRGPDISNVLSDMRVPISHDAHDQSHFGVPLPKASHAQDESSEHLRWPVPIQDFPPTGQGPAVGPTEYEQHTSSTISDVGGDPAVSTHSLDTFNEFSDTTWSDDTFTHHQAAPVTDSASSDAALNSSHKHSFTSVHPTSQEHCSWPIHPAAVQQYTSRTQHLGRHVHDNRPLDGQNAATDGGKVDPDMEATLAAITEFVRPLLSSTHHSDSVRQNRIGSAESGDSTALCGNPAPPAGKPRKKRGEFAQHKLKETNATREMKACVTCRKQKIRCIPNEDDFAAPCAKCQKSQASDSGKIIHRSICCRTFTLSSVISARPRAALGITGRWGRKTGSLAHVAVAETADDMIRTIQMLQGLTLTPFEFKVRKFIPNDDDLTHKEWSDKGVLKRHPVGPYCLADVDKTAADFSNYLLNTALEGLVYHTQTASALIRETYRMVQDHAATLYHRTKMGPDRDRFKKELEFLMSVVKLVWSMRHMTGTGWIAGEDKLDMEPPDDDSWPVKDPWNLKRVNEVSLPRMILAQLDMIMNLAIMPSQLRRVLDDLEKNLSSPKDDFFTMYLSIFMLLHEISVASKDRYRWARAHNYKARYAAGKHSRLGIWVDTFQKASYPLLAHWDYYRCGKLDDDDWDVLGSVRRLEIMEPKQAAFMEWSAQTVREAEAAGEIPKTPSEGCWEHEMFFVSHMFRRTWKEGYQTYEYKDE